MTTYLQLFLSFLKIGFTSFSGLSMIPVIRQETVRYGWMTDEELVDLIAIAEATPRPLALNSATFAGMRAAGIPGAVLAGLGVLAPSPTVAVFAAACFEKFRRSRIMNDLLLGIRPGSIGLMLGLTLTLARICYLRDGSIKRSHSTSISTADRKIASMPKEHIPVSLTRMCSMLFSILSKNARRLSPEQLPKISIRLQAAFSVLSAALSIGAESCQAP